MSSVYRKYERCFATPSSREVRNYSNGEYFQAAYSISQKCWTHYEGAGNNETPGTIYTGNLGPCAFLRLQLARHLKIIKKNKYTYFGDATIKNDNLLADALQAADNTLTEVSVRCRSRSTLLQGSTIGARALKAAIYREKGQHFEAKNEEIKLMSLLSHSVKAISSEECDVLYGRAGVLQVILFLRQNFNSTVGRDTAPSIIRSMFKEGVSAANEHADIGLPLIWTWNNKIYLGAAHGVVGIIFTLLHFIPEINELTKSCTQDLMILLRETIDGLEKFCTSGNLQSHARADNDELVHWCTGAPGYVLLLAKASQVFDEISYLERAEKAARKVIFSRGLVRKGVGLCHGISGNAYAFLALYRERKRRNDNALSDKWLKSAKHFANFAIGKFHQLENIPDHSYSLYEGSGGLASLLLDLLDPENSRFPCYEY